MNDSTVQLFWLEQAGPERDAAGEPVTRLVAGPEETEALKKKGSEIATSLGNADASWSGNSMQVSDDIALRITTAPRAVSA